MYFAGLPEVDLAGGPAVQPGQTLLHDPLYAQPVHVGHVVGRDVEPLQHPPLLALHVPQADVDQSVLKQKISVIAKFFEPIP